MFLRAAAGGTPIPLRLFLVPLLLPAPSHNWHHPDHLSVLARPTSDAPPEVQTGLAPGQVPVDGKLGGLLGAYFRYYNVYMRGPTEDDEAEAIRLADHARCDVCTTLVKNMLQRNFTREEELMPSGSGTGPGAASTQTDSATLAPIEFDQRAFSQIAIKEKISEDALLDWFEGHRDHGTDNLRYDVAVATAGVDPNTTDTKDVVRQQMLDKKVGCMKLFKDDFLYLGYSIRPCPEEERKKTPCVFPPGSNKLSELPSDHSVNTYELWKEIVFFSCEQTIGKYQSEMAEWLVASILEKGGKKKQKEDKGANKKQKNLNIEQLAEGACKTAAKCGRQLAQNRKPLEGGIGSEKPSMKSVNAGGNGASYGSGAGTKKKKSVGKKKNERKNNGKNAVEKAKSTSSGKTKKKSAKEKGNEKDEL